MKTKGLPFSLSLLAVLFLLAGSIAGCAERTAAPGSSQPEIVNTEPANGEVKFQWPDALHFAATGASGEAKMVSWASAMEIALKGPVIRVVNEAAWTNTYRDMAANKMVISQIDKSTLRDCIEAINEYALPDGGPWMAGLVWVDSLAATGFMVRGNSDIYKPEDIKPGTKIAIWNDKSATLNPFRSLLAWGNIEESDIIWVNTGDYDAGPRAVAEGRADIAMAAPVSPAVMEASSSPSGVRYISLDPAANPQGASAFLQICPLYNFGPLTVGPKSTLGTSVIVSYKYLGANLNTDPELIYNIVKWLDENAVLYKDRYESNVNMTFDDLLIALQTSYMPVHPGLVKYLKEKGVWNNDYETRNQKNLALFQKYAESYHEAMKQAAAAGIEIKPNNQKWIEFWESYKLSSQIPLILMHVSLRQDASVTMPGDYVPPVSVGQNPAPISTAAPGPSTATGDIPIEIQKISDAHAGDDITVVLKTLPGAEVKILFTMPNGSNSAYPQDNPKTAGDDGIISWTWNINAHVPSGEGTFTFTATLAGKETTTKVVKKTI